MFTRSIQMNPAFKPFSDKRVRQAMNYAIDSELIIKRLVKDKAYRAVSWLPPSSAAFDKTIKPYAYDPEKAKKLLADAGYANGFEFELTTSQNESWGLPIVEAIVPMLAKVGITPKPELVEMARLAEIAMKGDHQAVIGSTPTGPDALAALPCFYSRTARTACNYTSFDDAARTGDPGRRLGLLKQANPTGITRQYPEDIWIDAKSQAK
jgi:peptide/nickel transport system substrate-binding protein